VQKQGIGAVVASVLSAFLGVQSKKKYEEDFTKGRARDYIIVGLLGTILFIGTLVMIVNVVLHFAHQG